MRIDLHCHSSCSDGSLSPAAVAERAAAQGIRLFALTDHDTTEGFASTRAAVPTALRGTEVSCVDERRTVHLLLYQPPLAGDWGPLETELETQRRARRQRVRAIHERLADLGVIFDPARVLSRSGPVGRPHVAEALIAAGAVRSRAEAFDRYLYDGGPGDVPMAQLKLGDALELARAVGARTSLAHPHTLGRAAEEILRRFAGAGLEGLEAYYGLYKSRQRRKWNDLARAHALIPTGGSDFHGESLPAVARPGVDIPLELFERLCDWLGVQP